MNTPVKIKTLKIQKDNMFTIPKEHRLSEKNKRLVIKGITSVRIEHYNGTVMWRALKNERKNWPEDLIEINGTKYRMVKQ